MTGSVILDVALALVAIGACLSGYRQGGLSAALSLAGVIGGGYLGVQAIPFVLQLVEDYTEATNGVRFIAALACVTLCVVAGYAIGSGLGLRLRDQIRTRGVFKVESLLGAGVQVVTTLMVAWLIIVPVAGNGSSGFAKAVRGSHVLGAVGQVVPGWLKQLPSQTAAFINSSGFPVITDPLDTLPNAQVDAPNDALHNSAAVQNTKDSVLHVSGQAEQCSRLLQGTGWVVADGVIMTNAHVVAGTDRVQVSTANGPVETEVVYYNPQQDIALLRASDLHLVPMKWAEGRAVQGQDAIVMGYPMGGPFKATAARVRDAFVVSGPNIYADERVEREAYSVRGEVVQGNSGGPLIDTEGHVLGLVFGADVNEADTGYALTKEEVLSHVGDVNQWRTPVDTGGCVVN
ncbi:MAG TPA: MarP family serine protease [Candidatus Corynebacterium gallistercoris]|uniref:MarP family serine protease n=1 Tax=Candidatus Corynebacterium gallistercoris TaxID=2838530 RepID=A0A9D1RYH0_9CORY|nr:MarP family serine protease [Candidatus Corynebacterium gallistercoris]